MPTTITNQTHRRPVADGEAHDGKPERTPTRAVAVLLICVTATLAVVSTLHLSGAIHGGSKPYDPTGAGIAEAVIGIVLAAGAAALLLAPDRGRRLALAATGFALLGFVLGLTFTIHGGTPFDIAYHATILPVLIATAVLLAPRSSTPRSSGQR
jgi:peptidoglycan/LPS O-acetylase OafA/YrhL